MLKGIVKKQFNECLKYDFRTPHTALAAWQHLTLGEAAQGMLWQCDSPTACGSSGDKLLIAAISAEQSSFPGVEATAAELKVKQPLRLA